MAAESLSNLSELQARVLAWFQRNGPATDEQLERDAEFASLAPSTARKRRSDLYEMGLLRDTGERAVNSRGRMMILWECRVSK